MNLTPRRLEDVDFSKLPQDVSVLHRVITYYWDGEVETEEDVLYFKNLTETKDSFRGDIVNSFFKVISANDGVSKQWWVLAGNGQMPI